MIAPVPAGSGSATTALVEVPGRRPARARRRRAPGSTVTNAYVGSAKSSPDSRTPRRFASTISSEAGERQPDLVRGSDGDERRDGEDAGRDRHRDGEHVVGQQRCGGDEARRRAEVLPRDDVRAAARLVHAHRLPVREDDDPEQARDRDRDREDEVRRRAPTRRRGRRAPTRSRTRPTRAGRTRRSAARATSAAASRASGRSASAARRERGAGASARALPRRCGSRLDVRASRREQRIGPRRGAARLGSSPRSRTLARLRRLAQQAPQEEHAARA